MMTAPLVDHEVSVLQAAGIKAGDTVYAWDDWGWHLAVVTQTWPGTLEACNVRFTCGLFLTRFPEHVRTVEEHSRHLLLE